MIFDSATKKSHRNSPLDYSNETEKLCKCFTSADKRLPFWPQDEPTWQCDTRHRKLWPGSTRSISQQHQLQQQHQQHQQQQQLFM
ncbi:hypothetical protein RRG08_000781 [Elysia crispata]|uniref:Uncharacterized protein n=1 Tax=Elysia crispata TaxID=231223 RepID=A0AAE1D5R0_9GAST|nr:hypothetical protein RRG08_000781 [Elysia crispata]